MANTLTHKGSRQPELPLEERPYALQEMLYGILEIKKSLDPFPHIFFLVSEIIIYVEKNDSML
jgi:hypothetical protein